MQKPNFIGRDKILEEKENSPLRRLATFVVDAADADVVADEPIWHDGAQFEIEILGERRPATLVGEPLFDPKGERMRS